ncbi:MAG: DUF3429 domain-containing protein [Sphingomonas oligoaromativorans]
MNGETERPRRVPLPVLLLSAAGLLPPLMALFVRLAAGARPESPLPGTIGALGLIYSALILSFLGGIWWGVAVARVTRAELPPLVGIAVTPTIVALVLIGLSLGRPMLAGILLGLVILATPLVDRHLRTKKLVPPWWMRLRVSMSVLLGVLTIGLGLTAG